MSWSDVTALEQIKKLRDVFGVKLFIETGTFKGVNAAVHANNFEYVVTVEKDEKYFAMAVSKLRFFSNTTVFRSDSASFLSSPKFNGFLSKYGQAIIYLDAHFYNPELPPEQRWVILQELEALSNTRNVIIVIHDFDNGLGHLEYDKQSMNFEFLQRALKRINPNFHYYTNTKETCDIITKERVASGEVPNLVLDDSTADNLDYAWSNESKTYRGILYCVPEALDLSQFKLTELK